MPYRMLAEAVLPLGIILALTSMLFPLPAGAIDILLVGNLLFALFLLITTLYISEPIKLSAFPAVLLLAALFRLALNVATTRLILGSGQVGQAIEAFGTIVIGSNLAVGVVVFLMITLIQFIVVAKGSERVAEVAARFTLDALPGKQMSIDADVRAGLIDFESARQKRLDLQTESRFYGALDGAMKFVKGDAIAGVIIVIINSVGGLLVGLIVHDMTVHQAFSRYTLLTVGDGLLSQIPALLNSLAAGMVVTRVVRGDGASLAKELLGQIGQVREVKLICACLALVMSFIPRMPSLPFMFAGVLLLINFAGGRHRPAAPSSHPVRFQPKIPAPLQIEGSSAVLGALLKQPGFGPAIETFRQRVYDEWGLMLSPPHCAAREESSTKLIILVRGIKAAEIEYGDGAVAVKNIHDELLKIVTRRPLELIDDLVTRRTLDFLDRESPELVASVVPGVVTVTQLTELLKGLLRESVPIRNFDMILQAVAEIGPKAGSDRFLLAEVRIALRRVISQRFSSSPGAIRGFTLESGLDLAFGTVEQGSPGVSEPSAAAVAEFLSKQELTGAILLVSRRARQLLRECLMVRGVVLPVLAFEEIADDVEFTALGHITLSEETRGELYEKMAA